MRVVPSLFGFLIQSEAINWRKEKTDAYTVAQSPPLLITPNHISLTSLIKLFTPHLCGLVYGILD